MSLLVSTNQKRISYNSIFVIINWFINMVNYKLVKVIINTLNLGEIIINIVIRHYGLINLIVTN